MLAPADRDRISGVRRGRLKGRAGSERCVNAGADNEENSVVDVGDGGDNAGRGGRGRGTGKREGCTLDLGG